MSEALPASVVAGLDELGQALRQWVQTHRDAPLATHEQGVLEAVGYCHARCYTASK